MNEFGFRSKPAKPVFPKAFAPASQYRFTTFCLKSEIYFGSGIDKIMQAILKVMVPDKVILFGSQARGDAKPDIDYDILVIKSGIENGSKIEGDIYMNLDVDASVEVFVATPEIIEKYKDSIGCIIKPALCSGL
jgi:uncharacterized protein